ncbi:class I lanthipeptide [Chitinophaga nivalis]|uniref:Class I lanthipeptide n=1 Tax=Chitinophaga nivalis TaxID=2991709 RepID=A0ABT3IGV1_9BACT|nr:class I lanthipeptide [Chitinophaga nivalis]MCW3467132.1 class I lanthipeptide [Chitinophaga nivalis]MCW3483177.1 class I lanthipeptide [Chitinophaga nivalis]
MKKSKPQSKDKKLKLNKLAIARLNVQEMNTIQGGVVYKLEPAQSSRPECDVTATVWN